VLKKGGAGNAFDDCHAMKPIDLGHGSARIALVLPTLVGGGAERVNLSLARVFLARGYRVDIVLMKAEGELLGMVPEGARIHELGCERFGSVPLPFFRYLRREKPDAVIANIWPLTTVCTVAHRLAWSKARIAVVDRCAFSPAPRHRGRGARLFLRAMLAVTCRLADVRICISEGLADDVARLGHFRRDRIEVIYNPIEMLADPSADGFEGIWEGTQAKRVLTVGRLVEQKNLPLLLEAFSRVIEKMDARLVILGEGPLRGTLERKVAALGLERAVKLSGFMTNPASAYNSADLFVLSSDFEGFGNVIVEALACGVPVVSTDCPSGPREILSDGEFGALVPCGDPDALADAMLAALAREHDTERLKARASDFTPERAATAYLEAILPSGGTRAAHLRTTPRVH